VFSECSVVVIGNVGPPPDKELLLVFALVAAQDHTHSAVDVKVG